MKKLMHLSSDDEDLFEEATDIFYRAFPNSKVVQDMYTNPRIFIERIIVALNGEKVVGALKRGYNPDRKAISVDFLAVDENFRKKGIGHTLLSEAERFAREKENTRICLFPRTDAEVVNFYYKRGYVFIPEYHPSCMEKALS